MLFYRSTVTHTSHNLSSNSLLIGTEELIKVSY